jgi:hypothetical protein
MLRTRPQPSPRHAAALAAARGARRARAPRQVRPLFGKSGSDEKKYGAIRILAEEVTPHTRRVRSVREEGRDVSS